jgi:predicted pyridoxine 5'-phosphate oxidase superfamily flavin-nucleotide-binding protein
MSKHYGEIAFTGHVNDVQERYGSRSFYARQGARAQSSDGPDAVTPEVRGYLAERDSFYLATVSETGWPYVQYRGGPPGFLQVLDEHTLGWADFRGNLQYISTGNISADDRVALLVMDYPDRRRLKIFGHARIAFADDEPDLVATLSRPDYDAVIERAVVVTVDAFDWNCQQHITPRYTLAELQAPLAALRDRIAALEAQNAELRNLLSPTA